MDEGVARRSAAIQKRESMVAVCEKVAKFKQLTAGILRRVRRADPMMKMNFNFSPTIRAMIGESMEQIFLILFPGIEVRPRKWTTVVVSVRLNELRIFAAPIFQPLFLFLKRSAGTRLLGYVSGLKVIAQHDDQVNGTARHTTAHALPQIRGQPSNTVRKALTDVIHAPSLQRDSQT